MCEQLTDRQNDIECIVNLHKTVYGFKPRSDAFRNMLDMSDQDIDAYLSTLSEMADEELEREARAASDAFHKLEKFLDTMCGDHGISRQTAIRWEMQAHDIDDIDHWLYNWGIAFSDMEKFKS